MEQQKLKPCTSPEQVRPLTSSDSFSSRFLYQILQLSFVKYLLKMLQKASTWIGFVLPVETTISKVHPTQSPSRPGLLARKRRGRLQRLFLSMAPTSIQNILGYLPADWGQSNTPREIREALVNPSTKASKRKRDDVALEKQETWLVFLERDFPEDDSEDPTFEPSDEEFDSAEYQSQNDTEGEGDLELEVRDGVTMLKESSDPQGTRSPQELEVPPELPSPGTGTDADCDDSSSLSQDGEHNNA